MYTRSLIAVLAALLVLPHILGAGTLGVEASAPPAPATQLACRFVLGFATIRTMIGLPIVGDCLDDERFNPANGNAEQHTVGGLLVWRKADNWTAFTDGYRTWVNGPYGLQRRLNTQRFAWEADAAAYAIVGGSPSPSPSPVRPPASGSQWALAFDRSLTLPSVLVSNEYGIERQMYPTGKFLRIYFQLTNVRSVSTAIWTTDFSLKDAQGRTYTSDFQVRQQRPDGTSAEFSGYSVAPGTTVSLSLTFDVASQATGLVLHLNDGNSIAVR